MNNIKCLETELSVNNVTEGEQIDSDLATCGINFLFKKYLIMWK